MFLRLHNAAVFFRVAPHADHVREDADWNCDQGSECHSPVEGEQVHHYSKWNHHVCRQLRNDMGQRHLKLFGSLNECRL